MVLTVSRILRHGLPAVSASVGNDARIATEWTMPFRQWGPDCEVLAPLELRQEIAEEMGRAGDNYSDL